MTEPTLETLGPQLLEFCRPLAGQVYRYAEDQERSATRSLVATHEEHDLLEELLEVSKPPLPETSKRYHYLLTTPFRYPPLPYGSRFGARYQRGILYASETFAALQAELAFYRFRFFHDMESPPARLTTRHLLFAFDYRAKSCLNLPAVAEPALQRKLSSPNDYRLTQALGSWARDKGLNAIRYYSARTVSPECNLALLDPDSIRGTPKPQFNFSVTVSADRVSVTTGALAPKSFDTDLSLEQFLVEGELPRPAF